MDSELAMSVIERVRAVEEPAAFLYALRLRRNEDSVARAGPHYDNKRCTAFSRE
jgi:hypothetical protein